MLLPAEFFLLRCHAIVHGSPDNAARVHNTVFHYFDALHVQEAAYPLAPSPSLYRPHLTKGHVAQSVITPPSKTC